MQYLNNLFDAINKLAQPIEFKKIIKYTQGHMLLIGEVGNGKSTTANYLMLNLEKR